MVMVFPKYVKHTICVFEIIKEKLKKHIDDFILKVIENPNKKIETCFKIILSKIIIIYEPKENTKNEIKQNNSLELYIIIHQKITYDNMILIIDYILNTIFKHYKI